jgi:phage shock protein A
MNKAELIESYEDQIVQFKRELDAFQDSILLLRERNSRLQEKIDSAKKVLA